MWVSAWIHLTELELVSIGSTLPHVPVLRCEEILVSMSSTSSVYTHLTPGNCSKDCTCDGVMRWDAQQWAGKWRSVPHSWVMRWHTLKHCTSPYASLHSASMIFFQSKKKKKQTKKGLSIHWSNMGNPGHILLSFSFFFFFSFFSQLCIQSF